MRDFFCTMGMESGASKEAGRHGMARGCVYPGMYQRRKTYEKHAACAILFSK